MYPRDKKIRILKISVNSGKKCEIKKIGLPLPDVTQLVIALELLAFD